MLALGPAFIAAIAYVDPGNVAANLSVGAQFGYLLLWVLVLANLMAMLIQYQSAKLGLVTGRSLPRLVGERTRPTARRAYWLQAELVAAATDIAEVIGGALALKILFGLPLVLGGMIVGAVSLALLLLQSRRQQRRFEGVIIALLAVILIGFLSALFIQPPDGGAMLGGLLPRFDGTESILLACSMIGATVMPHAIYIHSQLVLDRFGAPPPQVRDQLLRHTRIDVIIALVVAGAINIGLLLVAATSLPGRADTDTIEGAHAAIAETFGPVIGVLFGLGLLASGLASTSVGAYAGSTIMAGLLHIRVPLLARRAVTLIPALVILGLGFNPTLALVLSQVVLSFGIPFALIPLLRLTGDPKLMGKHADGIAVRVLGWTSALLIVALNAVLLALTAVALADVT